MKGVVLAAGNGTRLFPVSEMISKTLLPVYDKPMIYYPLSTLMQIGIRDIAIVINPSDQKSFEKLIGNGAQFGLKIHYRVQAEQKGIVDALMTTEDFVEGDDVCLILGDNIFHHTNMREMALEVTSQNPGAIIFCTPVTDPRKFGVVELDDNRNILSIEEKPTAPKSHNAVTGLFVCDKNVFEMAKELRPSVRGELEITDLIRKYLEKGLVKCILLNSDTFWIDAGAFDSLHKAGNTVRAIQKNVGKIISCPEEIALSSNFISRDSLLNWISKKSASEYYLYLARLCEDSKDLN